MAFPICFPDGRFAFRRSYIEGLYVRHDGSPPVLSGNLLTFVVAGSPDALVRIWFHENFVGWTSNRWTLDHVQIDASYEYPTGGQIRPLPQYLSWGIPPGRARASLFVDTWYSASWTFVPLPAAPDGYWLPPPLT